MCFADKWNNENFVFVKETGEPMHPDTITSYCGTFRKKYNKIITEKNKELPQSEQLKLIPRMNPHSFRHTAVSMLIENGTDIITVSKIVGHAKVSTTTDIYSHIMQKSYEKASETLANVLIREQKVS